MAVYAPKKLQGFYGKFTYTPPGGGAAVTFKSVSKVTLNVKRDVEDSSDHDNAGWKSKLPGMGEWTASIDGIAVDGDTTQTAIEDALYAGTELSCSFYRQLNSGAPVWTGTGYVMSSKIIDASTTGVQPFTFEIEGDGALTRALQP